MNISLTILCVIAVLFAMAGAFLAQDDVERGAIFPWQYIGSIGIGFLITHGEYIQKAYAWIYADLVGDGIAGIIVGAGFASLVETGVASLPMLAGIALHVLLSAWDERAPLMSGVGQSRRGRVVAFLRWFAIR